MPVAMDLSRSHAPFNRRGRGRGTFNNSRPCQYTSNVAQLEAYNNNMDQMQVDATQVQETPK
jgi:hypothetical protein